MTITILRKRFEPVFEELGIDPGIPYVEAIYYGVYLSSGPEGEPLIVKIADKKDGYDYRGVQREYEALQRLKGVKGVASLSDLGDNGIYLTDNQVAVIKNYIEAPNLENVGHLSEADYSQLEETINQIHGRGVAELDLSAHDILLSDIPYLVDFGEVEFREEKGHSFEKYKKQDLLELKSLYKEYH